MARDSARSQKSAEFLGLLSFAAALMLLISLATYDPSDPAPFFRSGAAGPARNFIGPIGAFLAELLVPQLFGMAALLLPIILAITGWKLFWCKPIDAPYTKASGVVLMLMSLTAFLTMTFGSVAVEGEPVRAGGAVGDLLSSLLTARFNRTGAYIVVATALFVSVILATQFSFAEMLARVGVIVTARWQAARTAWAHFLETRRKERMRREVIKKHTQKEKAAPDALPKVMKGQVTAGDVDMVDDGDGHEDENGEDLAGNVPTSASAAANENCVARMTDTNRVVARTM
jgi:S-DNA-T family DNA segregation ATPase FtsK/SpoIIIE